MKAAIKFLAALIFTAGFVTTAGAVDSAMVKGAKTDYESFKKEMSEQLETVDRQLTELKKRAQEKGSHVSKATVRELEETRTHLRAKLDEVKDESKSSWANMKASMAKSMEDLNKKVQEAMK